MEESARSCQSIEQMQMSERFPWRLTSSAGLRGGVKIREPDVLVSPVAMTSPRD